MAQPAQPRRSHRIGPVGVPRRAGGRCRLGAWTASSAGSWGARPTTAHGRGSSAGAAFALAVPTAARATVALAAALLVGAAWLDVSPPAWATELAPAMNSQTEATQRAAPANGDVTWSVAPADADGPDGRHWVELVLEPGGAVTEHLAVTNLSKASAVFALSAADGYFTASGRFSMLDDPSASVGAGTWIDVADSVSLEAGATAVVPFTVTVPELAEPGDHAAGVAASVIRSGSSADGASLAVTSRFGFRVMTRVLGELRPGLEVARVEADYDVNWNPARPGRVRTQFELVNTGNTRLMVEGAVQLAGGETPYPASNAPPIELLPGESRQVETVARGVWPLARLRGTVIAAATAVAVEGLAVPSVQPVKAGFVVWAPPWPQLMSLLGCGLLVGAGVAGRRRSRRRVAALVAEARASALAEFEIATASKSPRAASPREPR